MYDKLIKSLRYCSSGDEPCESCKRRDTIACEPLLMSEAADAIESLLNYEALYRDLTDKGLKTIRELLDKYPKWISAEERLPEKPGMYLVWIHEPTDLGDPDYSYVDLLKYDAEQGLWQNEPYAAYNAHLEFVDKVNGFYVSHWMEKPTPPKEETE